MQTSTAPQPGDNAPLPTTVPRLRGERPMQGVLGRMLASFGTDLVPWGRRESEAASSTATSSAPTAPRPAAPPIIWGARLWGPGFELPGGADEIRRLAALLPLSSDHRLLLGGRGMTGAATVISGERRCPISVLVTPEQAPQTNLGEITTAQRERVTLERWSADQPAFARRHHHALLVEAGHLGALPAPLIAATAAGLYQQAEIVMVELVQGSRQPERGLRDRWLFLEGRPAPRPEAEYAAAFAKAGFRVNVTEDMAERHALAARRAWAQVVESVVASRPRPPKADLARMVAEIEKWLLRLRLLEDGAIRMLRWHASLR